MKLSGQPWTGPLLGLLILLPASLLLWSLAYQAPLRQLIHVGGELEARRRFDDAPFLTGVNGPEPGDRVDDPERPGERLWWWEALERSGARPYRWTQAEAALRIPGAGGGPRVVEILAGGRPGGAPTVWEGGPGLRYELMLPEGTPRRYRLLVAPDARGDLRLTMATTPYAAPGDPRELGFVLYEVRVAPASGPPAAPAWPQLGWLALATAGVYLAALAAGAGAWGAGGLAAAGALGAAYALAFHRPALALFTPTVATLAGVCAAAALGGRLADWAAARRGRAAPGLAPVAALVAAAFALRAAGMLHPHALYSDSGLQANKLFEATLGRVFLTAGLPSDAGGGQAPYPPGPFIALMPLQLLLPAGHGARVLLMQLGTALLDSMAVAAVWLILRRAGAGRRAALLGAACYLLPTAALESFSVGELANLGGQALALPFIVLLALGALRDERPDAGAPGRRGQAKWGLIAPILLCVALLAHSGVTLSVGALVAAAWALACLAALRRAPWPVGALRLSLAAAGGLGLALALFYTAPVYLGSLLGREGGGGGGATPGAILAEIALAALGLAPPARRAMAIPALLGAAAVAGLALLWATRRAWPRAAGLRAALAAWWGGALITQGLLLVADQGVRWALFLYPALCLSAGPLLAALWRRGRAGRLVAALALAAILAHGLAAWIAQVRDYYHI